MSNRYYSNFPACPVAIVSAISAGAGIFTIVDAKACRGGDIILEIDNGEDFDLSVADLEAIARILEVDSSDVFISGVEKNIVCVAILNTGIDFGFLFPGDKEEWFVGQDECGTFKEQDSSVFEEELTRPAGSWTEGSVYVSEEE